MSGTVLLLPLYGFLALTRTTVPFFLYIYIYVLEFQKHFSKPRLQLILFNKAENIFLMGCYLCLFTVMNFLSLISFHVSGQITTFDGFILCIFIEPKIAG